MSVVKGCERTGEFQVDDVGLDVVDKPRNSFHVTYLDLIGLIYAIILHLTDVGFDIYLAYAYFITGKYFHFAWTVAFIATPTIIITLISVRMYVEDSRENVSSRYALVRIVFCIVGIVLQPAPLIRYCDSFRFAVKSLKFELQSNKKQQEKYYLKMLNEDSDVALLRVFECYLESAPQQVLQMTLLLNDYSHGYEDHTTKQVIMLALSFTGMAWCMVTYHRCIRFEQEDKKNITAFGTSAQFFWHLNFTVSRILAISAIAALYPFWTCIAVVIHWCVMTMWVAITTKTNFCGKNHVFEYFFSGAVGLIYIFNFISLKDGPTRQSYLLFYLLCFVENVIASTIWGIKSVSLIKAWVHHLFTILPVLTFAFSVIFLVLYYQFLHPNKVDTDSENYKKVFYGNKLPKIPKQRSLGGELKSFNFD